MRSPHFAYIAGCRENVKRIFVKFCKHIAAAGAASPPAGWPGFYFAHREIPGDTREIFGRELFVKGRYIMGKIVYYGMKALEVLLHIVLGILYSVQVVYAVLTLLVGTALVVGGAMHAYNGIGGDMDSVIIGGIMCGIGLILLK